MTRSGGRGLAGARSTDRALEGQDQALDGPRSDPSLDVGVRDGLEPPALPRLVIQDLLELVPGQPSADEALANLQDPILHPLNEFTMSHVSTVDDPAAARILPQW
jgi:hypothetical protein